MIVTITQEEVNMLQILTGNCQNLQNSLNQSLLARKAAISLLEKKYNAVLNEQTGQFVEIEKLKKRR